MSDSTNQPDSNSLSGVSEKGPSIGAVEMDNIQFIHPAEHPGEPSRIGAVEAPAAALDSPQQLAESPTFRAMEDRLNESARIAAINEQRSVHRLEQELASTLFKFDREYRLEGLMIASPDGLVIAKSDRLKHESVLAALAALCDGFCERVRKESILASVDEVTLRSRNGARLTIRGFAEIDQQFLLVASSPHAIPMWMTDEIIRKCSGVLRDFLTPLSQGEKAAQGQTRRPSWRRFTQQLLAPFSTSTLLD